MDYLRTALLGVTRITEKAEKKNTTDCQANQKKSTTIMLKRNLVKWQKTTRGGSTRAWA